MEPAFETKLSTQILKLSNKLERVGASAGVADMIDSVISYNDIDRTLVRPLYSYSLSLTYLSGV